MLALPIGLGNGPVHIHKRFLQESFRLHFPSRQARPVDTLFQREDVCLAEAPGKISGGRRVRDPLGTQAVEENLILPPQFNVLDALPTGQ